jgi:hypothetical protein
MWGFSVSFSSLGGSIFGSVMAMWEIYMLYFLILLNHAHFLYALHPVHVSLGWVHALFPCSAVLGLREEIVHLSGLLGMIGYDTNNRWPQ